jgi:hypothetical protein
VHHDLILFCGKGHAMRAKATPRPKTGREKKCRTCRASFPAGQIINGQCPTCSGLVPLPLRGEGGKFLPGLTPTNSSGAGRGRRDRVASLLLAVVLPLLVLAECEAPMFPDGILPAARIGGPAVPVGLLLAVGVLVAVAVVAWPRRSTGHSGWRLAGAR